MMPPLQQGPSSPVRRSRRGRPGQRGAALLTTLVLATVIAVLAVSYLAVSQREMETTRSAVLATRAELGERAAFEEATSLLRALTAEEGYLVTLARRDEGGRPVRYAFVTQPAADGIRHVPLFAGGETLTETMPDFDGTETSELAERALAAPWVSFAADETARIIDTGGLLHLGPDGQPVEEHRFPETGLLELDPEGEGPYATRYTYWIEDLEGYPNLDRLGLWTDPAGGFGDPGEVTLLRPGYGPHDSRLGGSGRRFPLEGANGVFYAFPEAHAGQNLVGQAAPGLAPREVALAPWPVPGLRLERHPYYGAHRLLQLGGWEACPGLLSGAGVPKGGAPRFVRGLHPYLDVPLIPYGHGYADEGQPRFAINEWVARRDMGLVAELQRNLPQFEERKGGFPEDYLATLVANLIDYADEDDLPSTPANTVNGAGYVFRGVDSYATVNEFFVKFLYRGYFDRGSHWELSLVARPYAEFWNTFDRPARLTNAQLKFRFIEPIRITSETARWEFSDADIVRDEPFQHPVDLEIPPNGIVVHDFGEIEWRVRVEKFDPDFVSYPTVEALEFAQPPEDPDSTKDKRNIVAQYELHIDGAAVDSAGRFRPGDPPPTASDLRRRFGFQFFRYRSTLSPGEHFMRSVVPGLDSEYTFGGNAVWDKGFGNHLGDPWMPYYSGSLTSPFSENAYFTKATPGYRNLDLSWVPSKARHRMRDQMRVRDWPDGGYDNPHAEQTPSSDADLPSDFFSDNDPRFAPWRISNRGRYFSAAELGHLHDPVMWGYVEKVSPTLWPSVAAQVYRTGSAVDSPRNPFLVGLPENATPSAMWGGGNTLRIGRPEHPLFDRPGRRASQWLDLLHSGVSGSNLGSISGGADAIYVHHDPRLHQPPPAAADASEAPALPFSLVYSPEEHAESHFRRIDGRINLNTAPTQFEVEMLLRGARSSGDLLVLSEEVRTPAYSDEAGLEQASSLLRPEAIPLVARGLMEARPYYSPSHLARVFSELLDWHDALPEARNDAEAEEPFARLFNLTSFSSRHFRIHSAAEVRHRETGELVSRGARVDEVFLSPVYGSDGQLLRSELRVLASRRK